MVNERITLDQYIKRLSEDIVRVNELSIITEDELMKLEPALVLFRILNNKLILNKVRGIDLDDEFVDKIGLLDNTNETIHEDTISIDNSVPEPNNLRIQ